MVWVPAQYVEIWVQILLLSGGTWSPHLSVPRGNALTARTLGVCVWGASRHQPLSFLRSGIHLGRERMVCVAQGLAGKKHHQVQTDDMNPGLLVTGKVLKEQMKGIFFFFFSPSMVCNSGDLNLRSFSSCLFLADLANSYSCWVWDIWTAPVMCPFRCRAKLGCLSVGYRV